MKIKEIKEIKNSNLETGRTKALIRMIKKWSENCSVKLKSYEIENAVLDFFSFYKNIEEDYSITVRDFFEFFYDTIPDDSMKSYIMTALNRAKKACTFADNNEIENSVNEWKKIFGNDLLIRLDRLLCDLKSEGKFSTITDFTENIKK